MYALFAGATIISAKSTFQGWFAFVRSKNKRPTNFQTFRCNDVTNDVCTDCSKVSTSTLNDYRISRFFLKGDDQS